MDNHVQLAVLMITWNAERLLGQVLAALPPHQELIVVDSGSQDATLKIAREHGAKIFHRDFTNFAEQRNYALSLASCPWVLFLDADEILDTNAASEISRLVQRGTPQQVAFRIKRCLVFMGRKMHFGRTADEPIRLFYGGGLRFKGSVHEVLDIDPRQVGKLSGVLWHDSYEGLSDYLAKCNRYTDLIATKKESEGVAQVDFFRHILRPWTEFLVRYVLKLGFLDGYPGYVYAYLSGFYTFMKYAKFFEKKSP